MKNIKIRLLLILFLTGCYQEKVEKSELNYLSFKISKATLTDNLKAATVLLDRMDGGNGISFFVSDGNLCHTVERGFRVMEMPETKSSTVSTIRNLNQNDTKQLFQLVHFFNENDIHTMTKRKDGIYNFRYMQNKYNKYADFKKDRMIVYLKEEKDTCSNLFNKMVILDRYKNIVLVAPKNYMEPNLPLKNQW